jgi:hypothetical protein
VHVFKLHEFSFIYFIDFLSLSLLLSFSSFHSLPYVSRHRVHREFVVKLLRRDCWTIAESIRDGMNSHSFGSDIPALTSHARADVRKERRKNVSLIGFYISRRTGSSSFRNCSRDVVRASGSCGSSKCLISTTGLRFNLCWPCTLEVTQSTDGKFRATCSRWERERELSPLSCMYETCRTLWSIFEIPSSERAS